MNSTYQDYGDPEGESGFAYSFGLSLGVLAVIIACTAGSYYCSRIHSRNQLSSQDSSVTNTTRTTTTDADRVVIDVGVDPAALRGYPKFLYSQAKLQKGESIASCCSICLADYKDTDMLRLLPDCGHLFHRKCVDSWLRLHSTCPLCRSSPAPTPMATPLAEVAPLAGRRD